MNETPHTHQARVQRLWSHRDSGPLRVTYGTTVVTIRRHLMMRLFGYPSAEQVARRTKVAIRRHDKGSLKVATGKRDLAKAAAGAGTVHSDWWMDSQERMDELHAEALVIDRASADQYANAGLTRADLEQFLNDRRLDRRL